MRFRSRQISSSPIAALRGGLFMLALLVGWQVAPGATAAHAQGKAETIRFHGRTIQAPDSWPVYRRSRHPGMCVRLDRPAVYLGTPAANQDCPAGTDGRRRAILVEPPSAARARAQAAPAPLLRASTPAGNVFTGLGF